jgi:hypothetical protein
MMPEAMCDFDMATDLVNGDDRVLIRKVKSDCRIYGAIDLLVSRGVSSRSSDEFSAHVVSKSRF